MPEISSYNADGGKKIQQRIIWLDTAKGCAVLLVVLGHVSFLPMPVLGIIYAFHMPLFFFLSGILLFRKQESFLPFLKKKVRTLIIPYYLFLLLQVVVLTPMTMMGFHLAEAYLPWDGALVGNSELWYLFALFFIEMLLFVPAKCISREQLSIGGGILIALAIVALRHDNVAGGVFYEGFQGSTLPYGMDVLILGGFFVVFGMAMGAFLLKQKIPVWVAMISCVIAIACGVINYHICGCYHISVLDTFIGNPLLFLLTASGAILCFVAIIQRLPDCSLLCWLGRLSLAIYAVHWIFVPFGDYLVHNYLLFLFHNSVLWRTLCGLVAFVTITLMTIPVVRFIEKWCPWMMGRECLLVGYDCN